MHKSLSIFIKELLRAFTTLVLDKAMACHAYDSCSLYYNVGHLIIEIWSGSADFHIWLARNLPHTSSLLTVMSAMAMRSAVSCHVN